MGRKGTKNSPNGQAIRRIYCKSRPDKSHAVDFTNLFARLGDELDANLGLALEEPGRDGECLVLELGDAVLAGVVHRGQQLVVDENVELVGLPLTDAPELQAQL